MNQANNNTEQYVEIDERWKNIMLKIGREQSEIFAKNPDVYVDILITTEGTRLLMRWIYHFMICRKIIIPIEEYSSEQKQQIWDLVLEKCRDKCQNKTKLIEVSKVFCLIDYFLNQQQL